MNLVRASLITAPLRILTNTMPRWVGHTNVPTTLHRYTVDGSLAIAPVGN